MAKDRFDREIDYLRVSVTDRCNLGCVYCKPAGGRRTPASNVILTAEEAARLARVAMRFGLRKIRLTGGEPLLRADIFDVVSGVKASGVRDLSLTTNGQLLAGMVRGLRAAGLDRVNVSLDTMDADKYMRITGGEMRGVLDGIEAAEAEGLAPVKINMVPMRGVNDDEIEAFARLTYEKPVHVRFIEFMPTRGAGPWDGSKCVKAEETVARVAAIGPLKRLPFRGRGPSRNYMLDGAKGVIGFISPVSHAFCYACNRLRMSAMGRIRPCLFSSTEVDVLGPMRAGADDHEVERLLALAIEMKPEGNYLKDPSTAALPSMSGIGG